MASRMERYYKKNNNSSRTNRNKRLYNSIYSYGKYSNIEGIASIDNTNEIDITKIKEMLDNREKYQTERKYRRLTNQEDIKTEPIAQKRYTEEEKNYDIMDVLSKAKENKQPDDKERVLSKTSYNVLKNLNLKEEINTDDEDLKEMIQTITNTSMLNKMDDADLASDMFSDLKATNDDTKVSNVKDFKELINENKQKEQTMDNSFFTSSIKLKKGDFVNYKDKKPSAFKTIIITILILGIITAIGVLVAKKLGFF